MVKLILFKIILKIWLSMRKTNTRCSYRCIITKIINFSYQHKFTHRERKWKSRFNFSVVVYNSIYYYEIGALLNNCMLTIMLNLDGAGNRIANDMAIWLSVAEPCEKSLWEVSGTNIINHWANVFRPVKQISLILQFHDRSSVIGQRLTFNYSK